MNYAAYLSFETTSLNAEYETIYEGEGVIFCYLSTGAHWEA